MSLPGVIPGVPGLRALQTATHRIVFRDGWDMFYGLGKLIDGASSRDPTNTGDINVLQSGVLMGKITTSGLYAPSVICLSGGALTGSGTSLTLPAAGVTELVRRVGASGTFKITGPPVASGTVRTLTATYSAATGTTATITALGVNEVQTVAITGANAGKFMISGIDYLGVKQKTVPIAFNANLTAIQAALDTPFGSSQIVAGGTDATSFTLTFSGSNYARLPAPELFAIDISTDLGTVSAINITRTTTGVDGRFVSGSLIQPTDGSETMLTLIPDGYGVLVTNPVDNSSITVQFPEFPIAGVILSSNVVNYPSDSSLKAYVRQALSSLSGGKFVFDDMF